jgi:prevent-host-death family protein
MTSLIDRYCSRWNSIALSRVIEEAQKRGPQTITKNGRRSVVEVDAEMCERRTRPPVTLADFLAASPLRESGLELRRSKDRLRSTSL